MSRPTPYSNPVQHDRAEAEAERQRWIERRAKAGRGPECELPPLDLSHIPPMLAAAELEQAKADIEQVRMWVFSDLENYKIALYRRDRFTGPAVKVLLNHLIETHEQLLAMVKEAQEELK